MNKTDRLLAIILELQRNGSQRAEDLASTLEMSVRTIYRDIQALCEAGVPVIGAPGQGYSLAEGYFLPPVSFTAEEVVTLLLGIDFIEQQFDADYEAKAGASRRKIEAVLTEPVRKEADRVRTRMRLLTLESPAGNETQEDTLTRIRRAILEERKIRFHYVKKMPDADGSRHSMRESDPYGLVFVNGTWALVAFCHLRQELRHFRISRMSRLEVLDGYFTRPADFNLQTYRPPDDRSISVHILFRPELADKVKEQRYFYIEALEDTPDGLLATLRVRQPEEILPWILSWGAGAVVLHPKALRNQICEEAEKMLKRY